MGSFGVLFGLFFCVVFLEFSIFIIFLNILFLLVFFLCWSLGFGDAFQLILENQSDLVNLAVLHMRCIF